MAFGPHLVGRMARARHDTQPTPARRIVRNRMLGTEALYELLDERGDLVSAEVLDVPGLAPGTRVRLLRSATRAMEQVDPPAERVFAARPQARGPRAA
ncbi:MAG TPA: hypothetical protein VN740_01840 [Solirubrobacteraceae bacterium]|nr:hypothetical protein [Solirubrobacteraceae bacterium]